MDTGVSFQFPPPVEESAFTLIVTSHIKISSKLHFIIQNLSSFLNILVNEPFSTQNRKKKTLKIAQKRPMICIMFLAVSWFDLLWLSSDFAVARPNYFSFPLIPFQTTKPISLCLPDSVGMSYSKADIKNMIIKNTILKNTILLVNHFESRSFVQILMITLSICCVCRFEWLQIEMFPKFLEKRMHLNVSRL